MIIMSSTIQKYHLIHLFSPSWPVSSQFHQTFSTSQDLKPGMSSSTLCNAMDNRYHQLLLVMKQKHRAHSLNTTRADLQISIWPKSRKRSELTKVSLKHRTLRIINIKTTRWAHSHLDHNLLQVCIIESIASHWLTLYLSSSNVNLKSAQIGR